MPKGTRIAILGVMEEVTSIERLDGRLYADARGCLVDEILADVRPGAAGVDEVFAELRGQ